MIEHLNTDEILRYLGYPAGEHPDEKTARLIEKCLTLLSKAVQPKQLAGAFSLVWGENSLSLADGALELSGKAITNHLAGCQECILMACTLGIAADRLIRKSQLSSMAEGVVMDACCTALIEAVCDDFQAQLQRQYPISTTRFSPGYGDLPITLQKEFLSLLQAERKIGLCANTANLLIPSKSVTAILGIGGQMKLPQHPCNLCKNKERCAFCRHENKN